MRLPRLLAPLLFILLAAAASAAETRLLYLVRHGHYDLTSGDQSPLNALGREQAGYAAARLAALPVKFDTVVSSEFARAMETGDLVAAALGRTCARDALLNESIPNGVGLAATKTAPTPGAEAQFDAAWTRYAQPSPDHPRHDLLVCHGDVIRWFVCRALGADPMRWTEMVITNASLTVIQVAPDGRTRLLVYNDAAHVPLERQTWSGSNKPLWPTAVPKP